MAGALQTGIYDPARMVRDVLMSASRRRIDIYDGDGVVIN